MDVKYKEKNILEAIEWEIRESAQEGDVIKKIELDMEEMQELLNIITGKDAGIESPPGFIEMLNDKVNTMIVLIHDIPVVLMDKCKECEDSCIEHG